MRIVIIRNKWISVKAFVIIFLHTVVPRGIAVFYFLQNTILIYTYLLYLHIKTNTRALS